MLDHVDQRDRQIARRMQHREAERAGEHHIAGRDRAAMPERDRPGEQADGECHRDERVDDAQPLQIPEAALARGHLAVDGAVETAVLAAKPAIGAHQRHVADDVDHLAVDARGLVGEVVMQRAPRTRHAEHGDDHDPADHGERDGHRHAQCGDKPDRHHHRRAGRQHVPDEHRFERIDGIGGRGDAAGQHPRQPVREIARRMTREMAEQIAPQVAGDAHEGEARDPAGDTPEQVVGGDQADQQCKGEPDAMRSRRTNRELINQIFHAVLSRDRAEHGRKDRCHNHGMRGRAEADIAENERERPLGITTQAVGNVGCQRSVDHRPPLWCWSEIRLPQQRRSSRKPRAA